MAERPICIVRASEVEAVERPARDGVGWRVRKLGDPGGLTRVGVGIREIDPGLAGTHLHYHDVEEEWAYVLSGRGRLRLGALELPVRAGHFAGFPPGPRPHHFVAEGGAPLVLLEGGERRPDEDWRTYPELGVRARNGVEEPIGASALPRFGGDAAQLVHVDDVAERVRPHPLTPAAVRHQRGIDAAVGCARQACAHVRLDPGVESTTFHFHEHTDEWVYVLDGEAELRLGDARHRVRAGDFVAHPARGPAHAMRAVAPLTYLMGGQRLEGDVVVYPERGQRLTPDGFEPIADPV